MTDATRGQLERAYNLIQQEQLDEALRILKGIVAQQPNNGDAWWLMANAVSDPNEAYEALGNVLRLNPHHVEAREAYDQLVSQFPTLGPRSAPPSPVQGQTAELSVDIDELLRSTGPLDKRRGDTTMSMPEDVPDVSDNYLDQLWASRDAEKARQGEAVTNAADLSASDLESLFGTGSPYDVPATTTEDEDLNALFMGESPKQAPAKSGDDLESLFGSSNETTTILRRESPETAILDREGADAGADVSLEEFFGGGDEAVPAADTQVSGSDVDRTSPIPASDIDLDALFESPSATELPPAPEPPKPRRGAKAAPQADPFGADTEPDFMKLAQAAPAEMVVEEQVAKGRRRREKQQPPPADQAAPPTGRQKAVKVVAEAAPPDPFEAERHANRRARAPRLLLLIVVVAIVLAVVFLIIQSQRASAPDPVSSTMATLQSQLTVDGFKTSTVTRDGDAVLATVCSQPGTKLQQQLYKAMESIATQVSVVRANVKSVQIIIVNCDKPDVRLYRATAPIDAVNSYIDSKRANVSAYRNSWQRN